VTSDNFFHLFKGLNHMAKTIVFAPISAAVAAKAVKAMVTAIDKAEGAQATLLLNLAAAVAPIGRGMTGKEWDEVMTPGLKAALEASPTVGEGSIAGYLSRMKKCGLAILSGVKALAPQKGETLITMYARIGDSLKGLKLANGQPIYAGATPGRKTATPASNKGKGKAAPPSAPRDLSGSAGKAADAEGGLNVSVEVAAARQLMGEGSDANNLAIMAKTYRKELAAFMSAHLAKVAEDALKRATTNRDTRKGTPPRIVPPANKPNGASVN
jgi:hypothetical protein